MTNFSDLHQQYNQKRQQQLNIFIDWSEKIKNAVMNTNNEKNIHAKLTGILGQINEIKKQLGDLLANMDRVSKTQEEYDNLQSPFSQNMKKETFNVLCETEYFSINQFISTTQKSLNSLCLSLGIALENSS